MRYIKAWIKKYILHVQSLSAMCCGYRYERDMLRDRKKVSR